MRRILLIVRGRKVRKCGGLNKKYCEKRLDDKSFSLYDLSKYVIIMYIFENMYKATLS